MSLLFVTTSGKQILLSKCGWMVVQPVKNLSYNSSDIFHRNWKLVKWKSHSVEVRCSGGIPLQFFNPDLCCCFCDRLQIPTNCSIFFLLTYTSKNNEIISHCTDSFLLEKINLITTLKKVFSYFQLFWNWEKRARASFNCHYYYYFWPNRTSVITVWFGKNCTRIIGHSHSNCPILLFYVKIFFQSDSYVWFFLQGWNQ